IRNRFTYPPPYVWRVVRTCPSPASDMVDLNAGASCYDPIPLRAVAELITGISRVRGRLGEITCPAFVAHAVRDQVVPVSDARELARRLGGPCGRSSSRGLGTRSPSTCAAGTWRRRVSR